LICQLCVDLTNQTIKDTRMDGAAIMALHTFNLKPTAGVLLDRTFIQSVEKLTTNNQQIKTLITDQLRLSHEQT